MKHTLFLGFAMLLFCQESMAAKCDEIIFVKADASGAEDGTSWKDAYRLLQDALDNAYFCDGGQEIWVAQGSYKPTVDVSGDLSDANPQNRTFLIHGNIKMYGGFRGDEGEVRERITYLYPTILTGDQKDNDTLSDDPGPPLNASDNSFNIMRMKNLNTSTIVDGFIFQGGNAVSGSSTLSKKIGGAIFNDGRGANKKSNPIIKNCIFRHNYAIIGGGAIYNFGDGGDANPTLINCDFRYNGAGFVGGAITNLSKGDGFTSDHKYENCVFFENISSQSGGAIVSFVDSLSSISDSYYGCTFVDNESSTGGGIYTEAAVGQGTLKITGCIFHSNNATTPSTRDFHSTGLPYEISFSNYFSVPLQEDNGNTSMLPVFVSEENLRLSDDSPLIDIGPILLDTDQDRDRDGHARVLANRMDMGAYEYLPCPLDNKIYVNSAQLKLAPSGDSFERALTSLHEGLLMANTCSAEPTIYISEGIYYPQQYYDGILPIEELRKDFIFYLKRDIKLIGGFPKVLNQIKAPGPSIISGDYNNDDITLSENIDDNAKRLMQTDSRNVNNIFLKNIVFANAVTPLSGRAIIDIGNSVGNDVDFNVLLEDCEFVNNRNEVSNGILAISSGVRDEFESNIELRGCKFQENLGRSLDIRHFNGVGKILLDSIEIIDNSNESFQQPGAAYIFASDNVSLKVNIENSLFEGNSTLHHGGGLALRFGVIGDVSVEVDINNCGFIDNHSERNGGAIYLNNTADLLGGTINIRNTFFSENSGANGGAIYFDEVDTTVAVNFTNSIFHSNFSEGNGAAIAMWEKGLANIGNCTFYENSTNMKGGAIYLRDNCNSRIANSIFYLNRHRNMEGFRLANDIFKSEPASSTTMTHSSTELSICPDNVIACTSMLFDQDPMINTTSGVLAFTPIASSPLIDAGSNELAPDEVYDFTGSRGPYYNGQPNYRIENNTIDIGAQEFRDPCVDELVLDPMDAIFAADNGMIRGAWTADNKITVLPGFTTTDLNHLILDADEVEIVNDYSFMSSSLLLINTEGCEN